MFGDLCFVPTFTVTSDSMNFQRFALQAFGSRTSASQPSGRWGRVIRAIAQANAAGLLLVLPGLALTANAVPVPVQPALLAQVTPTPDSAMTPVDGKINIRFVNETGAVIEYQIIGDTEFRILGGEAEMTLQNIPVATTLTFRRQDAGLLKVKFRADDPSGTIVVNVSATTDFGQDRTTLNVDREGRIFFN